MARYFFLFWFFGLQLGLVAQEFVGLTDDSDIRIQIEALALKTETLSSNFTQEKHISFISEPIITKGRFSFKRENLLRWEYNDPFNYVLILNDGKLLIDDEGSANEIEMGNSAMFKEINRIMSNALLGRVLDDSDIFEHKVSENESYYRVEMIPIDQKIKSYISKIFVLFEKKTFIVTEVHLLEGPEDSTKIKFFDRQINASIHNSQFTIK